MSARRLERPPSPYRTPMPPRQARLCPDYRFRHRSTRGCAYRNPCKRTATCGPDLEFAGSVNVWMLCNEAAGRGLSPDALQLLMENAGHNVLGVAKEYDEGTSLPDNLDVVVAAGGDGTVATVAGIALNTSAAMA